MTTLPEVCNLLRRNALNPIFLLMFTLPFAVSLLLLKWSQSKAGTSVLMSAILSLNISL